MFLYISSHRSYRPRMRACHLAPHAGFDIGKSRARPLSIRRLDRPRSSKKVSISHAAARPHPARLVQVDHHTL